VKVFVERLELLSGGGGSLQLSNAGGVAELIICYCGFNVFHWEDVSTGSAGGSATCRIWMFIVGCLD
jgi:hypothetical protein